MGIEEGTVAALISRSLEGPGDMDADDDVMGSSYVAPGVSPPCIGGHGPGGGSSGESASYQVNSNHFGTYVGSPHTAVQCVQASFLLLRC